MTNPSAEFESPSDQHSAETPLLSRGSLAGDNPPRDAHAEEALRAANKKLQDELKRLRAELARQQDDSNAEGQTRQAEPEPPVDANDDDEQPQDFADATASDESGDEAAQRRTEPARQGRHDEESIESYMASLLTRMRGSAAASTVDVEPARRRQRKSDFIAQEERQPEPPKSEPSAQQPPVIALPPVPCGLTPRPRMPRSDLAAMRELANDQARMAIRTHGRKQLLRHIALRSAAALGCLLVSFVVLGLWPFQHQFLFGCAMAGIVVGIYLMTLAADDVQKSLFQPRDSQMISGTRQSPSNEPLSPRRDPS